MHFHMLQISSFSYPFGRIFHETIQTLNNYVLRILPFFLGLPLFFSAIHNATQHAITHNKTQHNKINYNTRHANPSPIAWHRQDLLCSSHLEGFLERLSTSSTPVEEQVKLAKLVTLCSSENPERRSFIANFKLGDALKSIVNLLDQNEDSITAVVGDAVWILSFADPHSHKYFVEHAVDKMAARLVERTKALPDLSDAEKPAAALAVMWMAAGLQNLAASYCDTESGHCWWEYQFPEDETTPDSEYGVYLHQESPLEVDGKLAASKMAANDELVTTLQTLVCQDPMTVDDEEFWASEATLEKAASGTVDPKIITWAVTGLIKNLSMYEESYKITVAAKDCLCKLVLSEDWLVSRSTVRCELNGRNKCNAMK